MFYSTGNTTSTYITLGAIVLIVVGYFRNGTVYIAYKKLKQENYDKAEHTIKYPQYLKKSQKSYYHFIRGFIELNRQEYDQSLSDLSKALNLGLRSENDTAIVTLNLAAIQLHRKNINEAVIYLSQTESLKHKPELNGEIEKLKEEIKAAQNQKKR